ncbi:MAG: polysaccharide deacetylase family protein [Cellulosilyticaceae bacterium]
MNNLSRKLFNSVCLVLLCCGLFLATQLPREEVVVCTNTNLNNTKVDWWLVRNKEHSTPRVNDTLSFDLGTYDAHYVGDTSRQVLYLTFDEGYENGYTPAILDALQKTGVKAVFFVTSPYVEKNPDIIKRMVAEGHLVANHSKSHPSMPQRTCDPERFTKEFEDVSTKYKDIVGEEMPKLFRPPMGHYSEKSLAMTQALGYKTVFWSFAYKDFDVNAQPSHAQAKKIILDNLHNGSIILLHAVSKTNAEVLEEVLTEAQNLGYTFELFQ